MSLGKTNLHAVASAVPDEVDGAFGNTSFGQRPAGIGFAHGGSQRRSGAIGAAPGSAFALQAILLDMTHRFLESLNQLAGKACTDTPWAAMAQLIRNSMGSYLIKQTKPVNNGTDVSSQFQ